MNILAAVYDWLSPIQDMDEEGFQAFVDGISRNLGKDCWHHWRHWWKRNAPEDKSKKIIKLLHSKGLCVVAESLAEPITDATFEGAKKTILYHWGQTKNYPGIEGAFSDSVVQ
jgi:hypothetical protein